mgnify:CR=1 FL=1
MKKTNCFEKIIISSENHKILNYAKANGFNIHLRDKYFSTSKVPMSEVYKNIASEIDGEYIAWINVTNPLAETKFYEEAISCYKNLDHIKYDCLLSACEIKENFFYKNKPINFKPSPWPRSQDLNPLYSLSFVINLLTREQMIKWGSCVGNRPYFFIKDKLSSWDIDDMIDFKFCEFIYSKKKFNS